MGLFVGRQSGQDGQGTTQSEARRGSKGKTSGDGKGETGRSGKGQAGGEGEGEGEGGGAENCQNQSLAQAKGRSGGIRIKLPLDGRGLGGDDFGITSAILCKPQMHTDERR